MTDNEKIAHLTSDAIRASGEKAAGEIMSAIKEAEAAVKKLREDGELLIDNIKTHTEDFAVRITGFVSECHATTEMFRGRIASSATSKLREVPLLINDSDLKELTGIAAE